MSKIEDKFFLLSNCNGLDMSADAPEFLARIAARLDAVGLSESAASQLAFGHHKGIAHLRGGTKSPGIELFAKLAPVLKTTAAWLAFGVGNGEPLSASATPSTSRLRYGGEVAAGQWLDQETHLDATPPRKGYDITANPRWPESAQYVVTVRGTSINRVAPHGALLRCVDPREIRYRAQDGDLIIVERRRNGGRDLERTAKRYRRLPDRFELWPDSTDPKHEPIIIAAGEDEEETTIEIIGLVDRSVHTIEQDTPWDRD